MPTDILVSLPHVVAQIWQYVYQCVKLSNQSSVTHMETKIATVGQVLGNLSRGHENYPLWASLCIVDKTFRNIKSPHVRKFGFWNPRNFGWWNPESWALESGILLKIRIQNPRFHWQRLEPSTWESRIHGLESRIQDCLGFPYMGRIKLQDILKHFKIS